MLTVVPVGVIKSTRPKCRHVIAPENSPLSVRLECSHGRIGQTLTSNVHSKATDREVLREVIWVIHYNRGCIEGVNRLALGERISSAHLLDCHGQGKRVMPHRSTPRGEDGERALRWNC